MSPESSATAPTSAETPATGSTTPAADTSDASANADNSAKPLELAIFIGLQAAGKTTFYQTCFAATHTHISKDLLRNNKRPERRQTQLIAEALAAGRSAVVDNTNATIAERATLIGLGRAARARIVGYYFPTTVGASLARNRERTGRARVPNVAIFARAKQLAPPTYAEGFDTLYTVAIAGEGAFTVTRVDEEAVGLGAAPASGTPAGETLDAMPIAVQTVQAVQIETTEVKGNDG